MARAARIIAVISKKSLNSEACMVNELFRGYEQCEYRREEFQKKVIALVMDDAKPVLDDRLETLTLVLCQTTIQG